MNKEARVRNDHGRPWRISMSSLGTDKNLEKKKLQESHCKLRIIKKQQKIENRRLKTKTELTVRNNQKPRSNRQKKNLKKKNVCRQVFVNQRAGLSAGLQSSL